MPKVVDRCVYSCYGYMLQGNPFLWILLWC